MEKYPWDEMKETVRSTVAAAILAVIAGINFLIWEAPVAIFSPIEFFLGMLVVLIICIISLVYKLPFSVSLPYSKG